MIDPLGLCLARGKRLQVPLLAPTCKQRWPPAPPSPSVVDALQGGVGGLDAALAERREAVGAARGAGVGGARWACVRARV